MSSGQVDQLIYRPNVGKQEMAHMSPAEEMLFGGAAGPGKTMFLLMEATRQIYHPKYNGIIFRRTYGQLDDADGLIARSKVWYPAFDGVYNETKHMWTFPSGAHIFFKALESGVNVQKYQGAQYTYMAFDELTQFTKAQYEYMFSRCRTDRGSGLRAYVRSATNPNGAFRDWVKERFITTGCVGKLKWFAKVDGVDTSVDKDYPHAKSRTYIPATVKDNPLISDEYISNLMMLSEIEKRQLLDGDWDAEINNGVYDNFSSVHNVSDEAEYKPEYGQPFWGVDDGYAKGDGKGSASYHPRVILIGQHTPIGGINIFYERLSTGEADYNISIDAILEEKYPRPEIAYVDSSAAMFRGALNNREIMTSSATHDVAEGIKNVRRLICDGNGMRLLKIHPRCVETISEFSSYQYKETGVKTGERIPNKMNDHCFVAGTMVKTDKGDVPIELIENGDLVLTRQGYHKVIASGVTNDQAEVWKLVINNGVTLEGTADHPIWTVNRGFVPLQELIAFDVVLWNSLHEHDIDCIGVNYVSFIEKTTRVEPVYNLSVDQVPEYFANGILVHNCSDSVRYMTWHMRHNRDNY